MMVAPRRWSSTLAAAFVGLLLVLVAPLCLASPASAAAATATSVQRWEANAGHPTCFPFSSFRGSVVLSTADRASDASAASFARDPSTKHFGDAGACAGGGCDRAEPGVSEACVFDAAATRADASGTYSAPENGSLATESTGSRFGGRMQGDRGAIDFSNGRSGALPDDAPVVRGVTNTAERFENGSGVTVDGSGNLNGVSVNSGAGKSVTELSEGIPNGQVGVSTVGDVRAAGGEVTPSPTRTNPFHCTLSGISAEVASALFTPTIANPCR
jgi:hypothetical protein